jgi:hypothetical protein
MAEVLTTDLTRDGVREHTSRSQEGAAGSVITASFRRAIRRRRRWRRGESNPGQNRHVRRHSMLRQSFSLASGSDGCQPLPKVDLGSLNPGG